MRRYDSGWRDSSLTAWHTTQGFAVPAAGMQLPMVEYDYGKPVALISYLPRNKPLPRSVATMTACRAWGGLYNDSRDHLPAFTVQYDVRNWAVRVYPHNRPAGGFLATYNQPRGWVRLSEVEFVTMLYRLRRRYMPDLSVFGVTLNETLWIETEPSPEPLVERWPGQLMSTRRRNHEPVEQTRMSWRNPCLDVDLMVAERDDRMSLVVDYKAPGARVNLETANMQALAGLNVQRDGRMTPVPAVVVSYEPGTEWLFRVAPLNPAARQAMSFQMAQAGTPPGELAKMIGGETWTTVTEAEWLSVLRGFSY